MIKGKKEALHVSGKPVSIVKRYVETGGRNCGRIIDRISTVRQGLDCGAEGCGLDFPIWTDTQGLKIAENFRYSVLFLHCNWLDLHMAWMTT